MRNMVLLLVLLTLTSVSLAGPVLRKAEAIEEGQHVIVKRATGEPPMLGLCDPNLGCVPGCWRNCIKQQNRKI
jgi:hypothetical protein